MDVFERTLSSLIPKFNLFILTKTPFENKTCNKDGAKQGRKNTYDKGGGKSLDRAGTEYI